MAKLLEALIARGRRVRRPREQREVAFGLAELSTHPEIHVKFLKKGGLKTLLHLLQVRWASCGGGVVGCCCSSGGVALSRRRSGECCAHAGPRLWPACARRCLHLW